MKSIPAWCRIIKSSFNFNLLWIITDWMWGRQVEARRGKNTLIFESLFQQVSCKGIKVRNLNLPEDVHGWIHLEAQNKWLCPLFWKQALAMSVLIFVTPNYWHLWKKFFLIFLVKFWVAGTIKPPPPIRNAQFLSPSGIGLTIQKQAPSIRKKKFLPISNTSLSSL